MIVRSIAAKAHTCVWFLGKVFHLGILEEMLWVGEMPGLHTVRGEVVWLG